MKHSFYLKLIPSFMILLAVLAISLTVVGNQQSVHLADAFIHKNLGLDSLPQNSDTDWAIYEGKYYWPQGPLPTLLLAPFVFVLSLFHQLLYQSYIQILLVILVGWIIYKLALKLKYGSKDSIVLSLGFLLGSPFIGVAVVSSSWFFSQIVTVLLLFAALYEYFSQKRFWLIGILSGLLALTRLSAVPILLFFVLEVIDSHPRKRRLKPIIKLLTPVIAALITLMIYNYLRFYSVLEQGYNYQILNTKMEIARSLGLFSIAHIPSNIYYSLLSMPMPVFRDNIPPVLSFPFIKYNRYGLSIFITSPYLLWMLWRTNRSYNKQLKNLLIATFISAVILMTYYGNGQHQFGYRYALDFLPLLFVAFMIKYREKHKSLTRNMKLVLLGSGLFNFYLVINFLTNVLSFKS